MAKNKAEPAGQAVEPEVDLLGQLSIILDAEYKLRPSRQAITNIEQQTNKPLIMLAAQCSSLMLPLEHAGLAVAEMMRAYAIFDSSASASYKNAQAERCADLIYEHDSLAVQTRLAAIFKNAVAGGYTASGELKAAGTTKTTTEPTPTAG